MTAWVAFTVFWVLLASAPVFAEGPRVGVFKFEVSENVAPGIGTFLYLTLLKRMVASGKYTVVDWEEIDRKRQYIAQSQPSISEEDAKRQAVHELGIEKMYLGAVQRIGERYHVGVKVLNLDLTVTDAPGAWAGGEDELEAAMERLTTRLLMSPQELAEAKREGAARGPTPGAKARLYVRVTPSDARVRILNIKPRYRPGVELAPGSYHIEVSKPGYFTLKRWTHVSAGEDKTLEIALEVGQEPPKGRVLTAEQREVEAVRWYRKAAEKGNADAQFNLGVSYEHSRGVHQDDAEAFRWYRKAAEQGHTYAELNLGAMYYKGRGVHQDYTEAVRWYRKAAEKGNADAQFNLGVSYEHSRGVHQDDAEAARWYRKAAEQGHTYAQVNLGVSFEHGRGVRQDAVEAVRWYRKAAAQGDANARAALDSLCKRSPSPVREACD